MAAGPGLPERLRAYFAAPGRLRQLAVLAGGLVALAGAYQLGQSRAGFNALQSEIAQRRLARQVSRLEADNRRAVAEVARLQVDEQVNREAYAQVEQQLAELQGLLMDQQEEVAFYRGIVGGTNQGSLRVQDFTVSEGGEGAYRLRFVLARNERSADPVRGQLQVRVEGQREGRMASVDAVSLTGADNPLPRAFDFRYFQEITAELRLPPGFAPERVVIRIAPTSRGLKASVESFPWAPRGA